MFLAELAEVLVKPFGHDEVVGLVLGFAFRVEPPLALGHEVLEHGD